MSILVFADSSEGKFKKSAFEAVTYAKKIADELNVNLVALTINANDPTQLYTYGAEKVMQVSDASLAFNAKGYASIIQQAVAKENATIIVFDSNINSAYTAPMIAAILKAGYASNVVALPLSLQPFTVKRKAFSNKAFNFTEISSEIKVISIAKNSIGLTENIVSGTLEPFSPNIASPNFTVLGKELSKGKVSIADADIVVSGGRGLKGPENWGMIEELAEVLGAATACSKPVSDLGWRPHSEHVGQTGKPVAANLYIAIGISGAIQHLAGINSSKVKVVINTDADAPFFKAADYGIVGDAFEVIPKLIEKLKEFKANNS
ncbi:MAG: electron transfer flavoprotein subunit alpha/FixB family protein [Lutibacter sp.]|nr:electron transfer flavoprotein subunit alpha/FixB family protein [Lutibacter sp.]MBP9600530.1 electron transfer flavoprotein subunit alpha/FixB family protein [Lutibacter sp.]